MTLHFCTDEVSDWLAVFMFTFFVLLTNPEFLFTENFARCKTFTKDRSHFPLLCLTCNRIFETTLILTISNFYVCLISVTSTFLKVPWRCLHLITNGLHAFLLAVFFLTASFLALIFWVSIAFEFYISKLLQFVLIFSLPFASCCVQMVFQNSVLVLAFVHGSSAIWDWLNRIVPRQTNSDLKRSKVI